jgi:PAS domain S-box-containing protein
MEKRRFTIGNKILTGFLAIIVAFVIYVVYSVLTINYTNILTRESTEVITPSADYLKEFKTLVIRSRMLATNWVYLPPNIQGQDQAELRGLDREYLALKNNLLEKVEKWDDSTQVQEINGIFESFEKLLDLQKEEIINTLNSFDAYEDAYTKFMAEEAIEYNIIPMTAKILEALDVLIADKDNAAQIAQRDVIESSNELRQYTIILGITLSIIGIIVALFMARSITKPIVFLRSIINKLAKGELADNQNKKFSGDEIGDMAEAVDKLVVGLRSTSLFAENIGNGKYDMDFQPLSEKDVLGNALIEMRNNLMKVAEEDKRRSWATEGLAKFGEILRKNNDSIEKLSDEIISNLIKYLNANQGGLYIVSDEVEENERYMSLAACYAWDKKKYLEQKVFMGEGLTGQAWIEKDSIYLTDVPIDYITITSGLGEANPRSILITPLKVNDEIYGVIEMASFNEFAEHEIDFVEKIAESIASTISSVKINQTTQRLLEESTEMTEQMRAQEEEMRQNMEELQATQEEMQRSSREREAREKIVNSTNMILEMDHDYKLMNCNNKVADLLKYKTSELLGKNFGQIVVSQDQLEVMKKSLQTGETWSGTLKFSTKSNEEIIAKVSAGKIIDPATQQVKHLLIATDVSNVLI